jgi:hypothetical protein
MKKIIFAMLVIVSALCSAKEPSDNRLAQQDSVNRFGVYIGMGVHGTDAPGVEDYLSSVNRSATRAVNFATTVEFFGGCEVPVSRSWAVKAEYSSLFKSYALDPTTYGTTNLRYDVQAPMLMAQYVIPGRGYFLRFGAGGGYHWGTIAVQQVIDGSQVYYKKKGIGARAEAEGQTAFDTHLFGYISASFGFEALGKVQADYRGELTDQTGSVSLNYFTAGIRFGLMYYF